MTRSITPAELYVLLGIAFAETPTIADGYLASNLYSCVPYIPPAAGFWLARRLHASLLEALYLARVVNLAAYLILVCLALYILPDLRILLFGLALMPMSLHQGASLSADSLTFGATFLLCAIILALAFGPAIRVRLKDGCAFSQPFSCSYPFVNSIFGWFYLSC